MSRRASNNSVSLFPFLAVLVCAMGALILLLLVTTRRIRSNRIEAMMAQTEVVEVSADIQPPPPAPPTASLPEHEPGVIPTVGPKVVAGIPPSASDETRVANHVERDRHALRGYDALLNERLNQWALADRQLHARYTRALADQKQDAKSREELDRQASDIDQQAQDAKETERRLEAQLASLRNAVEDKRAEPVNAISKFRIVPFDGLSGTVRHPILIECIEDRFRFLPEGIELTRAELEDFTTSFNPLLSGAAALNAHWALRDAQTSKVGPPYVLLVVRPSGSLGFYAAKRLLRKLDVPVGYELLGEKQELDLPAADSDAVRLCRQAVQRTLARRSEMRTYRPLAQELLADAARRTTARANPGSGTGYTTRSGTRSGDEVSDERMESFRRIVANMRTQNAQRPPGFGEYPSFNNQPRDDKRQAERRARNHRSLSTAVSANTLGSARSNSRARSEGTTAGPSQQWVSGNNSNSPGLSRLDGRPVTRPTMPPGDPATGFPGFAASSQQQANSLGATPQQSGSAGMAPPRLPTPQSATPSNIAPGITGRNQGGAGTVAANPGHTTATPGNPPTEITDGSIKPRQMPASSAPVSGSGSGSNQGKPPAGFANLTREKQVTLFRRAVDLFVDPNSVIVAGNQRIPVGQEEVSGPWLGAILTQIEAEVRSWGEAPMGTTWAPEVRFRISPGANRTHTRLRNALKRLGMRTTDEFTISPKSHSSADVFRTARQRTNNPGGSR